MKIFLILAVLFLAFVSQTSFGPLAEIRQITPNFVLITVMAAVLIKGYREMWWLVLAGALLLDIASGLPFGLVSAAFVLTVYLLDFLKKRNLSGVNFFPGVGLIVLAVIFYHLFLVGLAKIFGIEMCLAPSSFLVMALYNLATSFFIFYVFKKIFRQEKRAGKY